MVLLDLCPSLVLPQFHFHDGTIVNSSCRQRHVFYSFDYLVFIRKVIKKFTGNISHECFGILPICEWLSISHN